MPNTNLIPPFSPILIAGLALKHIPISLLQPLFSKAMTIMSERHERVFECLEDVGSPSYIINPTDLPFFFILETKPASLTLFKSSEIDTQTADARITGSFALLIDLLEGKIDGDAVFFSRDLIVEGDTEAVLALRNAIDGNDIDVFSQMFEPLGGSLQGVAQGVTSTVGGLLNKAGENMSIIKDSINYDLIKNMDSQNSLIKKMQEQLATLMKEHRQNKRKDKKKDEKKE